MYAASLSRKTLAFALLVVLAACADDPASVTIAPDDAAFDRAAHAPVRMMSRNLYLGADIDHVLEDPAGGGAIAWAEIVYTNYPARAAVLAGEIAARMPHLVGLQEVARYVVLDLGGGPPALTLDFLDLLVAYLAAYGANYQVVSRSTNFQAIIPMGALYVQYVDADAILVLDGVDVHDVGWRHFAPENQVNLDDYVPGLGPNYRSFQWADVTVEGQRLLFVNTHLEVQRWAPVQERQAAELLEFVNERDLPTFMVGDFNSAANRDAPQRAFTRSYAMITGAGFEDLWVRGRGRHTTEGATCCQTSNLANEQSVLDERIDFIFARNTRGARGYAGTADLHIFGHRSSDRFLTSNVMAPELGQYYLWPSDHAGLFGEMRMPPGLMAR
jgi:endonuclease/exonuclease/phosphatase family metal-dependent hydrolase